MAEVDPYRSFIRKLPVTLLLGMLLWLGFRPALDVGVCKLSEILIRAFEYPRVTRLVPTEHRAEVRRSDFRTDSAIPTVPLTEVHFNTILLLALSFALPRPWSRRQLERLLMGWCVLILLQSLNLVFHVKVLYALGLGEWSLQNYSDLARNTFGYLRYFTDLPVKFSAPFLIWLGFNWDHLLRLLGRDTPEAAKRVHRTSAATPPRRQR
jgi:hypothetical protein